MFRKQYGDVTIAEEIDVPKRGRVLCMTKEDETSAVYMDYCGFSLPDGTNAYVFGNKLVVVTRWAQMSAEEENAVSHGELQLVFAPFRFLQGALKIGDYDWSDITFTLYHCMRYMNDESRPVDEIVFIFCDKTTGEIVADREVKLPSPLDEYLRQSMLRSHENAFLDFSYPKYLEAARTDETRDFCDVLYDALLELSQDEMRIFRDMDADYVPQGMYITISPENEVIAFEQRENE